MNDDDISALSCNLPVVELRAIKLSQIFSINVLSCSVKGNLPGAL